jgi:hypothetical protein
MSTGFYTRVSNTVLSGNDLLASLSGNDIRALQYQGRVANGPVKTLTAVGTTGVVNELDANNWVDAVNSQLYLINGTSGGYIILGSDMPSIAKQYQNLFNLTTTSQVRTLKFELAATGPAPITLQVGRTTGAATHVYVNAATDASDSNSATLFSVAATGSSAGEMAGRTRTVLVSASDFTSGSEVVTFNVLSGSL